MGSCRAFVSVEKTCQRCGGTFACGLGCCWCDEIPVPPAVRAAAQAQFSDCLCRPCVEALAAGGSAATDAAARAPDAPQKG